MIWFLFVEVCDYSSSFEFCDSSSSFDFWLFLDCLHCIPVFLMFSLLDIYLSVLLFGLIPFLFCLSSLVLFCFFVSVGFFSLFSTKQFPHGSSVWSVSVIIPACIMLSYVTVYLHHQHRPNCFLLLVNENTLNETYYTTLKIDLNCFTTADHLNTVQRIQPQPSTLLNV